MDWICTYDALNRHPPPSTSPCLYTYIPGSAWFETGVSRPDLVLKDFVKVLHPELPQIKDHQVGRGRLRMYILCGGGMNRFVEMEVCFDNR